MYSVVRRRLCWMSCAGVRCELWQQGYRPSSIGGKALRRFLQHPDKIPVWIKPVLLRCLDQTEQDRAALRPGRRVRKEEVLPGDHKRLNAPFRTVVAQLDPSVLQICS